MLIIKQMEVFMDKLDTKIKEVVGVFGDNTKLQAAIFELGTMGFGRRKFSIIASPDSVKDQFDIENINISFI
jgi:hypothetical protein